jgi:flagellin
MASGITLTAGVRQNLLSLQDTASLMATTQNRLATGKKVNTALDNPGNFFLSQGLSSRASDLNSLLDSIGQATQVLKAADTGITSLTNLVKTAKSLATQAQQAAAPTATYSLAITGNVAVAADTTRATGSVVYTTADDGFTGSVKSTYTIDTAALAAAAADGNTFTLSNGVNSYTFENDAGADGVANGNIAFTAKADLKTALNALYGSGYSAAADVVTITGADYTTSFAAATGTAALTAQVSRVAAVDGSKLTLTQGSSTVTMRYVASGASVGAGTFTTLADLTAAINGSSLGNAGPALNSAIYATNDGSGNLRLESTAAFTTGDAVGTALNFGGTAFNANYNSTLAALSGTLSVTVGTGAAQTINFGTVTTRAALVTALSGITGVTASINGSNFVTFASTSSETVTIGGTNNSASGLFTGANIGVNTPTISAGTSSTVRAGLQTQYNALLTQINQLAADASYNGVNLLTGNNLKVVFNEQGTSSLTINGAMLDSTGLGLTTLAGTEFQNNTTVDLVIADLDTAVTTLRTQAAQFGSTLTTVEARQDFTKKLITTLQIGADSLVLADTNEEGANLLALQTRQSLSSTALSLANQANQAVLQLFR